MDIEKHSIDFIPLTERYGNARRLFTVWFSTNMTVLGVALGTLGIQSGLSLATTLVALIIGNAIGTVFMAAHSAQGPQLGVPQMIQSRAQFGVRGAAVPLVAVVVTYVLYCAANDLLIRNILSALLPVGPHGAIAIFSGITAAIAFVGYELIHRLGALMTWISSLLFAAGAWLLWTSPANPVPGPVPHFTPGAFILTSTQAAAWSLSYGPYVADYSRYLPATESPARTFTYTALGCFLGSLLIMSFGACLAHFEPALAQDPATGVATLFGSAAPVAQLLILMGVVQGNVLNLYSAYMSSITIFTGLHGSQQVQRSRKLLILLALTGVAAVTALVANEHFQVYFADALNAMLYLLVPWSAINLADYYFVRHGRYDIPSLYTATGTYGAYRWRALAVYCSSVLVQIPFADLSFFKGPIAIRLGADIAWLPGLLTPGLLYVLVEREAEGFP